LSQVYYAILQERTGVGSDAAFSACLDLAMRAGHLGYARINVGYTRVDVARNRITQEFLRHSNEPGDVLIMLDGDHVHPRHTLERLAGYDEDVVAALAFRRCPPYDPQMYRYNERNELVQPSSWEKGLVPVDAFGMAAIAIKRRVFARLDEHGLTYPYFRFWYPRVPMDEQIFPSEDVYFALACRSAGIECYVDTGLVSPHLTLSTVQEDSWHMWLADHPELLAEEQRLDVPNDLRVKILGERE